MSTSDETRLKNTVYVGGIDSSITVPTLHAAFLPFGEIVSVTIPASNDSSKQNDNNHSNNNRSSQNNDKSHRGFGYVEFENPQDALAAIDNMDQAMLANRVLNVSHAKPEKKAGTLLGSKVAVWEQEDWIRKYEVSEEDREAQEKAKMEAMRKEGGLDPMQALEALDVAGPRPADN